MNASFYAKYTLLRKVIKRTYWRMTNLSWKQFLFECVLRQIKTVHLATVPSYPFNPIVPEAWAKIVLPEEREFFVMIKPSGLHKEADIKKLIAEFHLRISREETYQNFFEIAAHIFQIAKIHDYRHALPEGYIWLKLLEEFYPETCQQTKVLYIQNGNEKVLKRLKNQIRRKIGVEFFRVQVQDQRIVTCMTPVHTSDEDTLEHELKVLQYVKIAY
jgi:hypothetical protein